MLSLRDLVVGFPLEMSRTQTNFGYTIKKTTPCVKKHKVLNKRVAATYSPAFAVPSALMSLTSLFG
ncbi:MAG: hypothetical protein LBS43_07110, partial [Prevotellaceae bacterium]|nr:hypothetical protein [Prevotellaceae bacterium]